MASKKFKSASTKPRRVALLSGHVFMIGNEWVDIPDFAWQEAYVQGCVSEDMVMSKTSAPSGGTLVEGAKSADLKKAELVVFLKAAIEENNTELFNERSGKPILKKVNEHFEKGANPFLLKEAWDQIQEEQADDS